MLSHLWHFHDVHCVNFVENPLFKSSGDAVHLYSIVCQPLLLQKEDPWMVHLTLGLNRKWANI